MIACATGELEKPEVAIRFGCGLLYGGDCGDQRREFAELDSADREVLHRAQSSECRTER